MLVIITASLVLAVGIGSIFFLGSDNPVEEICEEVIEEISGLEEIDFSFWDPEIEKKEDIEDGSTKLM